MTLAIVTKAVVTKAISWLERGSIGQVPVQGKLTQMLI